MLNGPWKVARNLNSTIKMLTSNRQRMCRPLLAVRGLPTDFADWVRQGAAGWGWSDVLPYFRRLETDLDFTGDAHGSDGPLPIRRLPRDVWPGFARAVADAAETMGFQNIQDHNAIHTDGYFPMAINNRDDQRVSAARAYLTDAVRRRPNLEIVTQGRATRIRLQDRRAIGVDAVDPQGRPTHIPARQVVVAAGALHSPALLLRSGIGPADHLSALGVPVVADRPGVGANLQDHPMVALAAHLAPEARCATAMRRHIHIGVRYSSGRPACPGGDMFILPSSRAGWHPLGRTLGSVLVCVNRPFSRGSVRLASADPSTPPVVQFRLLDDARDRERLEDGVHKLAALMTAPGVAAIARDPFPTTFSERVRTLGAPSIKTFVQTWIAARVLGLGSAARRMMVRRVLSPDVGLGDLLADPQVLSAWVQQNTCGSWHASGTCRMGAADDPDAVLDPACRVMGVDGLRVVDASIMPSLVSANTALATIMAAEKIADQMRTAG